MASLKHQTATAQSRQHRATPETLTELEQKFVGFCAEGKSPSDAAALTWGANQRHLGRIALDRPVVKRALLEAYTKIQKKRQMTREKVMEGFERAADMAETMSDPTAMVSAWREIGRMCGYYAVETKKVEVTVNGEIGYKRLASLSDADLLRLAAGETLEGEFARVVSETPDVPLSKDDLDALDGA